MSFPFPRLLEFLDQEKDQVEFMKIAADVGIGSGDIELAKLLIAFQIYKAYYAAIPRQIKAVHEDALDEIRHLRNEMELISNRTSSDATRIGQWVQEIQLSLQKTEPTKLADAVHKRLMDETVKILGGTLQVFTISSGQIDKATQNLKLAGYQAAIAIDTWQTISLRRAWASAFAFCLVGALLILIGVWFIFLRHQAWWVSLQ